MKREQVELAPHPPVVALPRLLEPVEVGVEILLLEPGRPVDALQHLSALVAPPVCARAVQQLEMLEPAGARDVRSAAEILEGAVGVDRDGLVVAELADALELERIVGEAPVGLRAVHHLPQERIVAGRHLGHLGLDPLEVLGRERPVHLEVVVEAVFDRGPEPDTGPRKELAHGSGQDVGRRVAEQLQGVGVAVGQNGEGGVPLERTVEVPDRPVHPRGERGARQSGADALGDLARRRAGRQLADAPVGQRDPDGLAHRTSCSGGRAGGSLLGA